MQKGNFLNFLSLLIGVIIVGNFLWQVYNYRADIFKKFDSSYWTTRYNESQWVVPNSKNSIGDDGLYMYAGYRYIRGDDPTLLNAEIPPLGKYMIGIFETLTGYTGAFSLFFGAFLLLVFFFFNKIIFKSTLLASLPILVFSFDPLFTSQIRAAYLDTLYAACLLLGFSFVMRKRYIVAGIAFGAFMAVKSPFLILLVYAVLVLYLFIQKQLEIKKVLSMLIPTAIVFLLSYSAIFFHGHGLLYFLKVQKYILHFYAIGAKAVVGAVVPMIFTDTWYTWYQTVQRIQEWTILWPLATIGGLVSIVLWLRKKTSAILLQLLWAGMYFVFLVFTPLFPRYLLLLLPFLYNLSIWSLSAVIKPRSS